MGKIDELIRQERHPAVNLILRALQHIKDKIEDGADVTILYSNDYLVVETKKSKLIIKRVEIDNVDRVKIVYMKVNKSCEEGSTKVVLKQYVINYNPQILSELIYEIDYIIEDAVMSGVMFEERIDNIITSLKALSG